MDAAERFRRSYFRDGRNALPTARPAPSPPRERLLPKTESCQVCNVARLKRERGWWANRGRTFYHFHCVTDEMLEAHIDTWGPTVSSETVLNARAAKVRR